MDRADKLLANTGRWSRKAARALIRDGRVASDGAVIHRPEEKVAPSACLTVDGARVAHSKFTYLMMNKPEDVLSSTEDRQKTVIDLLPEPLQNIGLFPVGRLDKDTEGLLLLTNDGVLAHQLLSPKKHVDKVYFARVRGNLDPLDVAAFERGMRLKDGLLCLPAGLELTERPDEGLVTLREGKFHQVKRMMEERGKPVVFLKRLSMGRLRLDPGLGAGEWRLLTHEEENLLRNSAF